MSNAFLDAINFAEARKVVLPSEFYALDLKSRQLATTVSLLSSIEQMKTVIDSVNKAIRSGSTFADFQKEVKANGINLPSAYLDLVFRQNVQTAYSHGRWLHQQRNKHNRPYLRYSSINDNRTRPSHSALNGIIRHIDDPFWLTHYPPWAFRCRCSVIAITEEKAQQLGITPDNAVPQGPQPSAFSTTPWTYGDLTELAHQKIIESGFDPRLFDEHLQQIKAEAVAVKKLTEVLTVSDQATDELFSKVSKLAMPKSADIRPSTIKMLIDYALGKATQLTGYLKSGVMSLADKLLSRWVGDGLAQVKKIAQNVSHVVQGKISLELASSLALGQVLKLDSPLLINNLGDVSVRIENAKDYGIDLEQLQAGQGVLFEMGLSIKVVGVEQNSGQTVYVLKVE